MESESNLQILKLLLLLKALGAGEDPDLDDDPEFDPSKFEEINTEGREILGEGHFGRVVEWDNDTVMKTIRTDRMSINDRKKQMVELRLHQSLDHENITKCMGTFINQNKELCIQMERLDYTLQKRIEDQFEQKGGPFEEHKIWYYFF